MDDTQRRLAGLYLMKKLDLSPEDGGMPLPLPLPRELDLLDEVLDPLVVAGLVDMDRRRKQYVLTERGIETIGHHIDEAEHYIDEFDGMAVEQLVPLLRQRRLDPLRVRFLWGWYQGEFDDLVLWQQRRGLAEIDEDWASYLVGDGFWRELATELAGDAN